jgi:hypothetical protein
MSYSSFAQNNELLPLPFQAQNGQFGYKNASQQIIIEAHFDEVSLFAGSYAFVKKNDVWGIINTRGKIVIPPAYESLSWTLPNNESATMNGEV